MCESTYLTPTYSSSWFWRLSGVRTVADTLRQQPEPVRGADSVPALTMMTTLSRQCWEWTGYNLRKARR
jgi:hypothetical protein